MAESMSTQVRDHLLSAGSPALTAISEAASEMEHGLFGRITDRVAANARVIRRAPEAIALTGIISWSAVISLSGICILSGLLTSMPGYRCKTDYSPIIEQN